MEEILNLQPARRERMTLSLQTLSAMLYIAPSHKTNDELMLMPDSMLMSGIYETVSIFPAIILLECSQDAESPS